MERGSARSRNRFNNLSNGVELPSFFSREKLPPNKLPPIDWSHASYRAQKHQTSVGPSLPKPARPRSVRARACETKFLAQVTNPQEFVNVSYAPGWLLV